MQDDNETATFWDDMYSHAEQRFSGNPNAALVREVTPMTPGSTLDLGCGEGGDMVWLARQGWQVTGVDERVSLAQHDLTATFPEGHGDLVCVQFLHSHEEMMPNGRLVQAAAAAVAHGGALLISGHEGAPSWEPEQDTSTLPSADRVLAELDLASWEVVRSSSEEHAQHSPDGSTGHRLNYTVLLRRR